MNNIPTEILNRTNTLFLEETLMGLAMQPKRTVSYTHLDVYKRQVFGKV